MARIRKATLRDVAEAAGVAESTASRALAGSDLISAETRQLIEITARRLGYKSRRKSAAGNDDSHKKGVIGVVVASLGNSFYPFLVDRVHGELQKHGYDMVLIIDEFSNSRTSRKIRAILNNTVDGVIFMTSTIGSEAVDALVESKIPTVLAVRSNHKNNVDVVSSDNHMAGSQAIRHLLSFGHRDIGFLLGPENISTAQERYRGARTELEVAGISLSPERVVWGEFNHDSGYSSMMRLWQSRSRPTAVFCANDVIAMGAMDACLKLGLQVPQEISIIGVDDTPMSSWAMISLTTVRQNIEELGTQAARRIIDRIEGTNSAAPRNDVYPTSLVPRGTTSPLNQSIMQAPHTPVT